VPRRFGSITTHLVTRSKDAALTAVQVFNNPLVRFKSETFIVLMNIAWTYLLHAHYRRTRVEYRYFEQGDARRQFIRTDDGSYRYWDLTHCLRVSECPLDKETTKNLLFLIGLRDEITHHMSPVLDQFVSARYQACSLNYNRYMKQLFGAKHGIDQHLAFSIQFQSISRDQLTSPTEDALPKNVRTYIARFDNELTADELNSERFAFRMLFVPKLVGKAGQADEVIEFLKADSPMSQSINRDYLAFKEVERPKHPPTEIVQVIRAEGYPRFGMLAHTELWRSLDAKSPGRGWGVTIAGRWLWYTSWIEVVRKHCEDSGDRYR
jgi:hypothetical protein